VDVESVFEAVTDYFDVDPAILSLRGDGHVARAVAAWLARRLTTATLRELAGPLGLGRPESVSNLTRRVDRDMAKSSQLRQDLRALESRIARKTKTRSDPKHKVQT
jgi:putative transposase